MIFWREVGGMHLANEFSMNCRKTSSILHRWSCGSTWSVHSGLPPARCVKQAMTAAQYRVIPPRKAGLGPGMLGPSRDLDRPVFWSGNLWELASALWPCRRSVCWVNNHTIIWLGLPEGSARQSGVALVLDRRAAKALKAWYLLSDRVLLSQFRYSLGLLYAVAAYAPTNEAPEAVKDTFYWTLEHAVVMAETSPAVMCLVKLCLMHFLSSCHSVLSLEYAQSCE